MKYPSALALLILTACGNPHKPASASDSTPDERIPVRMAAVQQRPLSLPVHASGILTSTAEQRLAFKTGGVIRRIYVDEGDVVRAGQLLAVLDKTEIDASVNQAQQGLAKTERDLARVQGLYRDSSATLELLENATTARDVARETARIATFNQQYSEIRATRPGKIIRKLMNEGEIIGPGMPVFVLFETGKNDWVVKINVSDRDWARLALSQTAVVMLDAYPNAPFQGRVTDLAPAADPGSGLYPVEIRIQPRGKDRFAPGLFAQVDIAPKQGRTYPTIPVEALVEGDGRQAYVFVLAGEDKVRKVRVEVAYLEGSQAVIAGGLEGIGEVVTDGAPYLTDGKKVRRI